MENDLGVKLLVRKNRGFYLTKAGEYLYQKSGQLLDDFERIKNETIQIGCGSQDALRLGYLKTYSGRELLNSNQLDLVLNDQRRAFSDKYVNFNLFEASYFVVIHEKHPMSGNPLFEPQMLDEIPIILIASKEQQEAEQDYYQNALGLGSEYIFAENNEEARLLVAGNRGVLIEEEFQEGQNMDFARKIPLVRYGKQMTKPYCLFWKVEHDNEKIRKFAEILKKHFL